MKSIDEAEDLGVFIPPMPESGNHHVISRGKTPRFYRPQDLKDVGPGNTPWVRAFEEILVGLYWTLDQPVPYAFRTPDGAIRSLDAGCIKMLLNRTPPEITVSCYPDGFIETVVPDKIMLDGYAPMKALLVKRIADASPE